MWAYETVFYQIYPLGLTGAPWENDGQEAHRIRKVLDWIPHLKKLGIGAVYFSPVFESDSHGYDTRDYRKIDCRLGTNADFAEVCRALHENGIRVVLDGVFNHAGRGFWAFQDLKEKGWDSPFREWFITNFDGNSNYNDGFWYEGWEGHYELVKLNLRNPDLVRYLIDSVRGWIDEFGIDGLRLDVAYLVDRDFLRTLRRETSAMKEDFFLAGEILGGDYRQIMNGEMCHSATNYECYKGLYSSFNSRNLFEINHSLIRQFGSDPWTLYHGEHLLNFADNHDVSRLASTLTDPADLPLLYTILFTMPGMPCLYYGSEWGTEGRKEDGDHALRPAMDHPQWNDLTDRIAKLARIFREEPALHYGDFRSLALTNEQCVFERSSAEGRILTAINMADHPETLHFDSRAGRGIDLVTGRPVDFGGGLEIPPKTGWVLKPEA